MCIYWQMGVNTSLWSELEHKQLPGKVSTKNKNTIFFACKLWVKRVCTFGVVLYRNQWPVNFILHFAKLHIGSSIRYENTLLKYYFLKVYIVKRNVISFNCFYKYILKYVSQTKFFKMLFNRNYIYTEFYLPQCVHIWHNNWLLCVKVSDLIIDVTLESNFEVSKGAKIRNRYNQVRIPIGKWQIHS